METADLVVVTGVTVSSIIALGVAFSNLPVATMVNSVLIAASFLYGRRERAKKEKLENVQRLNPKIYQPIYLRARTQLEALSKEDEYLFYDLTPPQGLKYDVEYATNVSESFQRKVDASHRAFFRFGDAFNKLANEYDGRLRELLGGLSPPWRLEDTYLRLKSEDVGLPRLFGGRMFTDFLKTLNESPEAFLAKGPTQTPTSIMNCPKDILEALKNYEDLPSYHDYVQAKKHYRGELENLVAASEKVQMTG